MSINAFSFEKIADMVDKNNKKYTKNMLSSYQYFTRADTRRLLGDLGGFKFKSVKEGVAELLYLDKRQNK